MNSFIASLRIQKSHSFQNLQRIQYYSYLKLEDYSKLLLLIIIFTTTQFLLTKLIF